VFSFILFCFGHLRGGSNLSFSLLLLKEGVLAVLFVGESFDGGECGGEGGVGGGQGKLARGQVGRHFFLRLNLCIDAMAFCVGDV